VRRELELRILNGAAHAVAALADRRVGEADHGERGQSERDVDLHVDLHVDERGIAADHGRGAEAGEHGCRSEILQDDGRAVVVRGAGP
jgi:hypothetical protein